MGRTADNNKPQLVGVNDRFTFERQFGSHTQLPSIDRFDRSQHSACTGYTRAEMGDQALIDIRFQIHTYRLHVSRYNNINSSTHAHESVSVRTHHVLLTSSSHVGSMRSRANDLLFKSTRLWALKLGWPLEWAFSELLCTVKIIRCDVHVHNYRKTGNKNNPSL